MEILLIIGVGAFAIWWFFLRDNLVKEEKPAQAPYKVETPAVNAKTGDVVEPNPTTTSWHTAPPADTKPVTVETVVHAVEAKVESVLDVNHDGKVTLADVKEAVKKVRKPRTPKAEPAKKPAVKKAAPVKKAAVKKPAAIKAKANSKKA